LNDSNLPAPIYDFWARLYRCTRQHAVHQELAAWQRLEDAAVQCTADAAVCKYPLAARCTADAAVCASPLATRCKVEQDELTATMTLEDEMMLESPRKALRSNGPQSGQVSDSSMIPSASINSWASSFPTSAKADQCYVSHPTCEVDEWVFSDLSYGNSANMSSTGGEYIYAGQGAVTNMSSAQISDHTDHTGSADNNTDGHTGSADNNTDGSGEVSSELGIAHQADSADSKDKRKKKRSRFVRVSADGSVGTQSNASQHLAGGTHSNASQLLAAQLRQRPAIAEHVHPTNIEPSDEGTARARLVSTWGLQHRLQKSFDGRCEELMVVVQLHPEPQCNPPLHVVGGAQRAESLLHFLGEGSLENGETCLCQLLSKQLGEFQSSAGNSAATEHVCKGMLMLVEVSAVGEYAFCKVRGPYRQVTEVVGDGNMRWVWQQEQF